MNKKHFDIKTTDQTIIDHVSLAFLPELRTSWLGREK